MEVILLERIEKLGQMGDVVKVKVLGIDDRGKVRLSMKSINQETGEDATAEPVES